MISLIEINRLADKFNVLAETIEKDYIISWILNCLSKSQLKNNFIFYGGTAIKRMYFEEHRFSEDIDLISEYKYPLDEILEELKCLSYAKENANILLDINQNQIISNNDRVQIYINYLGYPEIVGAPKEIRLDFSMKWQPYGKVIQKNLIESYSDLILSHAQLSVMSLNTILANKLSMLLDLTRNEPRDLFDIWFLLNRLSKFDFDFNQVKEYFYSRMGFRLSESSLNSSLSNSLFKTNWNIRLEKQISELPTIETVNYDIKIKLKEIFNTVGSN